MANYGLGINSEAIAKLDSANRSLNHFARLITIKNNVENQRLFEFIINPETIQTSYSAKFASAETMGTSLQSQNYLNSASEPIQINGLILDTYCAGKSLRKPLTALRALTQPMEGSLNPQPFYFVFGSEKIGLCVLTNVKINTSKWLGGEPAYAIVDLTMIQIPDPDTAPKPQNVISSSNLSALTNRQKIDASKNATSWLQKNKSKIPSNIRKIISVNSYKLLTTDTGIISMLDPKNNVLGIIGSWNGKVFDPGTQTLIQ